MSKTWVKLLSGILLILLLACEPVKQTSPAVVKATPIPSKAVVVIPSVTVPSPTQTAEKEKPQPQKISLENTGQLKQSAAADFVNPAKLVWAADGSQLVVYNDEGAALLDGKSLENKQTIQIDKPASLFAFSNDAHSMAVSADQTTVELREAKTGKTRVTIKPDSPFSSLTFSPDGEMIALTSEEEIAAVLWNADSGQPIFKLTGFQTAAPAYDVSFTPDGKTLIWHARGLVQLMDIAGQKLGPVFEHEDFVTALAVSTDGKLLATCAAGTQNDNLTALLNIWDTQSGKSLHKIPLENNCTALQFLPGSHILAGGVKNQIIFWDADSQKKGSVLQTQGERVTFIAFSADGTRLAGAGTDNKVLLWQAAP